MNQHQNDPDFTTEPVKKIYKWYRPNTQKLLFTGLFAYFILVLGFISLMHFNVVELNQDRISLIAISIILTWIVLLVAFYAWAIYTYNINLGYHQKFWDILWEKIREARIRKKAGLPPLEEEPAIPNQNPYKNETLGLPHGTVRGTIALTLLVGSLAMLIMAIGAVQPKPTSMVTSSFTEGQSILFNRLFDFFVVAFQMMIAFYFGANSLKYLKGGKGDGSDHTHAPVQEQPSIPDEAQDGGDVVVVPPTNDGGQNVQTGLTLEEKEFQSKARSVNIDPATLRAIAQIASGYKAFIKEPGADAGEHGRLALRFDGNAFYTELQKAGKNPEPLEQANSSILWKKCQPLGGQSGPAAYNLLHEAITLAKAQGLTNKTALMAGNWGVFGIPGKWFSKAGFPDIINLQNKFELSETNQFEAFITLCKANGWFELLKANKLPEFASKYWAACNDSQNFGAELESLYNLYESQGWNGSIGSKPAEGGGGGGAGEATASATPNPAQPKKLGGHTLLDPTEIGEGDDV